MGEEATVPCSLHATTTTERSAGLKKRNVGRAARRRRRKLRDIQAHEAPVTVVLPVDRSRVSPAVRQLRLDNHWNSMDETSLQAQLGYVPGNVIRIAARWSDVVPSAQDAQDDMAPVVAQLYPLVWREPHAGGKTGGLRFKARKRQRPESQLPTVEDATDQTHTVSAVSATSTPTTLSVSNTEMNDDANLLVEPFPTIFWLTHPILSNSIAQLERDGYGIQCEHRLATDATALASMQRAHASYSTERMALLSPTDAAWIQTRGWSAALQAPRGVAGCTNPRAVKCLHAHTAHYLSGCTDNVLGQWVLEALPRDWHVTTRHDLPPTHATTHDMDATAPIDTDPK